MFQNVCNEVLNFQAKVPSRPGVCVHREWQKYTFPFPSFTKNNGLIGIGNSMSIRNIILGVNNVIVSYLIRYGSLSQNATDIIIKCGSYFIAKCERSSLKNMLGFLLKNATVYNLVLASVYFKNIT